MEDRWFSVNEIATYIGTIGEAEATGVFVLATTNRPKSIDAALRRPGRFDRVVWMQLPDERGRAAILQHYLKPLKLDSSIDIDVMAADLAAATDGASGADLEYLCQTAARVCVKEAVIDAFDAETLFVTEEHLRLAARQIVDFRHLGSTIGLNAPRTSTP